MRLMLILTVLCMFQKYFNICYTSQSYDNRFLVFCFCKSISSMPVNKQLPRPSKILTPNKLKSRRHLGTVAHVVFLLENIL